MLRLYLDESGDHHRVHETDIAARYLGLVGVIVEETHYRELADRLEDLKRQHFPLHHPDNPVVLHRREVMDATGPFFPLQDTDRRQAFNKELLELVRASEFVAVAVVIDKYSHQSKEYRAQKHPYHYCLQAMMERYCGLLRYRGCQGDIIAEARGARENRELNNAFREVRTEGTRYLPSAIACETLLCENIRIEPKDKNIPGLQLADLLANPLTRNVLQATGRLESGITGFGAELVRVATPKYNMRRDTGKIDGYGRVLLT
ncbi:MAG: DUF3800 domain-containing protein [Gemmatimonadota bacterium]